MKAIPSKNVWRGWQGGEDYIMTMVFGNGQHIYIYKCGYDFSILLYDFPPYIFDGDS